MALLKFVFFTLAVLALLGLIVRAVWDGSSRQDRSNDDDRVPPATG